MLLLRALRQSQQVVTQHQRPLQSSVLGWYGGNRTALAQQSVQVRTKKKKAGGSGSTSASAASTRKVLDLRADVKSLIDLKKYDDSMLNTIESLKKTYSRMRSGTTVSPDFLDGMYVYQYF